MLTPPKYTGDPTIPGNIQSQAATDAATAKTAAGASNTQISTAPSVDKNKENSIIQSSGITPKTDAEFVAAAHAAYGDILPVEYQPLEQKVLQSNMLSLQSNLSNPGATDLTNAGQQVSQGSQEANNYMASIKAGNSQAPMQLDKLQNALKIASGVGNQPLGTSEVFSQAGVGGYGALSAALNARGQEMNFKYDSMSNLVKGLAAVQYMTGATNLAKAQTYVDNYKALTNQYQFQQSRLDAIQKQATDQANQLDMLAKQHQYKMEESYYDASLKQGASLTWSNIISGSQPGSNGFSFTDSTGTTYLTGGQSSASGDIKALGVKDQSGVFGSEFADNCVKWLRLSVPNLVYNLWNKQDKQNAVDPNIKLPQVGDGILTSEGSDGHAALIVGINGSKLILQEANYRPGTVTMGRTLDLSNPDDAAKIYGYVRPNGQSQDQNAYVQNAFKNTGLLGGMKAVANVMYSGTQPAGAEQYLPSTLSKQNILTAYNEILKNVYGSGDAEKINQAGISFYREEFSSGNMETIRARMLTDMFQSKTLSATDNQRIQGQYDAVRALINIKSLMQQFFGAGGQVNTITGSLGLASGVTENIANWFKQTSDPSGHLVTLKTAITDAVNNYRHALTGAQFSDKERGVYENLFPNIVSPVKVNYDKIDTLMKGFEGSNRNYLKNIMGGASNYDKIFGLESLNLEKGYTQDTADNANNALSDIFSISLTK